jgi:hypothetical protein
METMTPINGLTRVSNDIIDIAIMPIMICMMRIRSMASNCKVTLDKRSVTAWTLVPN